MDSVPYLWFVVALVVQLVATCACASCAWLGWCFALCWLPRAHEVVTTGYLRELVETGVALAFAVDLSVRFACWLHGEASN